MYTDSGHLSARTLMSDEPSCSNVLDPQLPRCAWLLACSVSRKDASPQSSASARRIPVRILSGITVQLHRNTHKRAEQILRGEQPDKGLQYAKRAKKLASERKATIDLDNEHLSEIEKYR